MEPDAHPDASPVENAELESHEDFSAVVPGATRRKLEAQLARQAAELQRLKREQEQRESEMLPPVIHPPRKAYKKRRKMAGEQLSTLPRRKQVVDLRVAGKPVAEIAEIVGVSQSTVGVYLRDWVLSQTPTEEATAELRKLMHERLESMHERHWRQAMGIQNEDGTWKLPPSREAGEFCLKIMDREAKLMGVDLQPSNTTLLISAESIAAYLGWDPQDGHSALPAVIDVEATEETEQSDKESS